MFAFLSKKISSYYLRKLNKDGLRFVMRDWSPLFELSAAQELLETKRFTQNLKPVVIESLKAEKVLIISPHPDDDAFGCAGSILKFSHLEVKTVYVTDAGDTEADIVKLRGEAETVCSRLRSKAHFLHHAPGDIPIQDQILTNIILDFKPDIIFTTFMLDDHDDHRRVNHLLKNSIIDSGFNGEVWSYQIYSTVIPNIVVNITEEMDRKYEVMELYKTIYGNRDWPHYIRGLNAANCRFLSGKNNKYGEAFFAVPSSEYTALATKYFNNPEEKIYHKSYK